MVRCHTFRFTSADGLSIFCTRWDSDRNASGVVQIAHGLGGTHWTLYRFNRMSRLCRAGRLRQRPSRAWTHGTLAGVLRRFRTERLRSVGAPVEPHRQKRAARAPTGSRLRCANVLRKRRKLAALAQPGHANPRNLLSSVHTWPRGDVWSSEDQPVIGKNRFGVSGCLR